MCKNWNTYKIKVQVDIWIFISDPPKSSKKKSKQKSIWLHITSFYRQFISFVTAPYLINYLIVLILFALVGNLFKGDIVPVLLLSVLLMQYLFWFSGKAAKLWQ